MFKTIAKRTFYVVGSYCIANTVILMKAAQNHPDSFDSVKTLEYVYEDSVAFHDKIIDKINDRIGRTN